MFRPTAALVHASRMLLQQKVLLFVWLYVLIQPIYNRETVTTPPPPRRNVNLPEDFGQESSGPTIQRHRALRGRSQYTPSIRHASRLFKEDAIHLKPQQRKRKRCPVEFFHSQKAKPHKPAREPEIPVNWGKLWWGESRRKSSASFFTLQHLQEKTTVNST